MSRRRAPRGTPTPSACCRPWRSPAGPAPRPLSARRRWRNPVAAVAAAGAAARPPMRLVVARCSVDYSRRLSAHLPIATRLLLVKADGSVLVHSDGGSYKPLNWMSPPCRVEEEPGVWRVVNKAGEELRITIEEILHD